MPSQKIDLADLPDVDLLIALLHPGHVHHAQALDWFSETAGYLTTPITEAGFLRLTLNQSVMGSPVSRAEALVSLGSVKSDPRARFLPDDATFTTPAIALDGLVGYRQVTDIHLVNLASAHKARLVTFDGRIADTLVGKDREYVRVIG